MISSDATMNDLTRPLVAQGSYGAWNRFWFSPADPTALCLIRLLCGMTVFAIHFAYCFDLAEFFGRDAWVNVDLANEIRRDMPQAAPHWGWQYGTPDSAADGDQGQKTRIDDYVQKWGVHPDLIYSHGNYSWSIWFHVTDPIAMRWIHGVILGVMFLFAVGFATRVTSVLTWIAALQYVHRSPTTLFGMDQMMMLLLLYLMIGPSGAAFSIDHWLAKRGYSWARLLSGFTLDASARAAPSVSANLALRLMQVHMCFIYAAAGLAKLLGSSWWAGTAIWWTVANYEFSWLRSPAYMTALQWLCGHRPLWEIAMSFGVAITLSLQISFPYLVWQPRWRWLMISGSVLLHTTISALMGLLGFGLCMVAMALAFVPGESVREWVACWAIRTPEPVTTVEAETPTVVRGAPRQQR